MKYVWAGLAIVAAVAALFFRPPHGDWGLPSGGAVGSVGGPFPAGSGARDAAAASAGSSGLAGSVSDWAARTPGGDQPRLHAGGSRSSAARIVVYVAGEVNKPGVYTLASGARAQEALTRAGGPKPDADLVAVNLAAPLDDGTEVAVPKIGAPAARGRRTSGPRVRSPGAARGRGHGRRRRRSAAEDAPAHSVDLNAADASELETLPGIGPALAERIVDFRETNGPFASVDELADVAGITPHLQEVLSDFVVIR